MSARRIGILGGTFDPIHCGHLDMAEAAQAVLSLDRVFVVTANIPPHQVQTVASAYHRFAMVALAVAYFGAKILHPASIWPAQYFNFPVKLLNTMQPDAPGTLIVSEAGSVGVKAIAAKDFITAIK